MNGLNAVSDTAPGNCRALEVELGDGKAALERVDGEMRHAGQRVPARAEAEIARRVGGKIAGAVAEIRAVEDARVEHLAVLLGLHRKMAEAVGDALGRPVEDFPVDQPARRRDSPIEPVPMPPRGNEISRVLLAAGRRTVPFSACLEVLPQTDISSVAPRRIAPVRAIRSRSAAGKSCTSA